MKSLLTKRTFNTLDANGCQMKVTAFIVKDVYGNKIDSECRYMAVGEVEKTLNQLKQKVANK